MFVVLSIETPINFVLNAFKFSKLCILGGLFDEETSFNNIGSVSDETAFRLRSFEKVVKLLAKAKAYPIITETTHHPPPTDNF